MRYGALCRMYAFLFLFLGLICAKRKPPNGTPSEIDGATHTPTPTTGPSSTSPSNSAAMQLPETSASDLKSLRRSRAGNVSRKMKASVWGSSKLPPTPTMVTGIGSSPLRSKVPAWPPVQRPRRPRARSLCQPF